MNYNLRVNLEKEIYCIASDILNQKNNNNNNNEIQDVYRTSFLHEFVVKQFYALITNQET